MRDTTLFALRRSARASQFIARPGRCFSRHSFAFSSKDVIQAVGTSGGGEGTTVSSSDIQSTVLKAFTRCTMSMYKDVSSTLTEGSRRRPRRHSSDSLDQTCIGTITSHHDGRRRERLGQRMPPEMEDGARRYMQFYAYFY